MTELPVDPYRMPPVGTDHVVTVHAVAQMLKWSSARVRSIDEILKPTRLSDGSRAYDVDRVLVFVHTIDVMDSLPPPRYVVRVVNKPPAGAELFRRRGRLYMITTEPPPRTRRRRA